jgi:predicted HAD superfamily hydrolase
MLYTPSKRQQTIHLTSDNWLNSQYHHQFELQLSVVDVVSFDLFDTLIQRDGLFSPKDLFYRVQEDAEKKLELHLNDFVTVRVRAEEIARVRAWGCSVEEVALDQIYTELGRMIKLETGLLQSLKMIELDCERSVLTPLESGKQLFKAALGATKTVVIVSDTYFNEDFITEIVRQNGYGDARKVYASSTYGKTKSEGSLYEIVLNDIKCTPSKVLHVGDNQHSDFTMALSKGIRAFLLSTPKHEIKWRHGLGDMPSGNLVTSAMLCNLSKQSDKSAMGQDLQSILRKTATENLSLLYFAYSTWLLEQLKNQGYKRVYFSARDGWIMKRFFDLVASTVDFEIDSRYLYISRAALYPSMIFTEPETACLQLCHNWDHLTIEDALRRISLTFEECDDLLASFGLTDRKLQLNRSNVSKFSTFLTKIWPMLERKNEEHYQLLVEYLRQEMVLTEEKAAFVDIGWHGSLQNCLMKLLKHLGITKDLTGYYLGTFKKPTGAESDFRAKGFLVDNDEPKWISDLVKCGPSVLELFHSADHGSVTGYKRNGKGVSPILEDNPAERKQFVNIIEPIQNIAFDFVAEQLERFSGTTIKAPDPSLVSRTALRFLYAPTAAEATTFGRLRMAADFGGHMKSITGALEWDIKKLNGETLPDGTVPMWLPGFRVLTKI